MADPHPPFGSPKPAPAPKEKVDDIWRPYGNDDRFEINQRGQLRTRNYDASKPLRGKS